MNTRSSLVSRQSCGSMIVTFLGLCLMLSPFPAAATTYYVDANHPSARDTNPGTEALPFKTISKATGLVNAGDTVFVKAGIYRETVILSRNGTQAKPITVAARAGHEGKVIINAAEPLANWRKCTGPADCAGNPFWEHIYYTEVAGLVQSHPESTFAVRQVFQHGKLLPRSRYPDTGWGFPTSMPDPTKSFVDTSVARPDGYFTGAVCHLTTAVFQIDQIPIASSSASTITLSKSPRYAISTRFGYYITSVVGEINAEGEWAYDPARKRIYLWPEGDAPQDIEFTYRQYCLRSYSNTSWNVVRGLTLRYAYQYGIFLYRSHHMTVQDNTVEHAYTFGIYAQANAGGTCDDNQILYNTIKHACYYGLGVDGYSSRNNLEGNFVYATGTESYGGDLMNGRGEGIHISGPYTRVYNNRVDRTGNTGIYVQGKTLGREISYNYLTNICLATSDSGGIYTGGFSDVPETDHFHHNIIVDVPGCLAMSQTYATGNPPTIPTHAGNAPGIYVDEQGNHRVIDDNTVIGSRMAGLFFHWAFSNVVQRNTLYDNAVTQIWFSGKNDTRTKLLDDTVLDNVLFATNAAQKTFYLGINYLDVQFGQSDRNYFYNPYNNAHIFLSRYSSESGTVRDDVTLAGWQALSGYDLQSREFLYLERLPGLSLARPRTSRIVYNPTLDVMTVDLEGQKYCDVQGNQVSGPVTLQPFESKILIAAEFETPSPVLP
jgi:parallel beta-helix repeat protein